MIELQLCHLRVQYHRVQCPILRLVGSGDLLLHRSQEALRVEEARHPEGVGSAVLQPVAVLRVSQQQT